MQLAQDISSRMYVKKRRRSGLRRGFLTCIIGEIDKSRCVSYFSTDPYVVCRIRPIADFTGGMSMTTMLTAASAKIYVALYASEYGSGAQPSHA